MLSKLLYEGILKYLKFLKGFQMDQTSFWFFSTKSIPLNTGMTYTMQCLYTIYIQYIYNIYNTIYNAMFIYNGLQF